MNTIKILTLNKNNIRNVPKILHREGNKKIKIYTKGRETKKDMTCNQNSHIVTFLTTEESGELIKCVCPSAHVRSESEL